MSSHTRDYHFSEFINLKDSSIPEQSPDLLLSYPKKHSNSHVF